jgi:hypothetical protein
MTVLSLGWRLSRITCRGYRKPVIPTEVEGPAVFAPAIFDDVIDAASYQKVIDWLPTRL